MQRWTALLLAALVVVSVAVLAVEGGPRSAPIPAADAGTAAVTDAGSAETADGSPELEVADAEVPVDPGSPFEGPGTSDAGALLPNGEVAPSLAAEAPKQVAFGAVLVTYRGAQGAPPKARTRDEALALAKTLAEEAKADFSAAVAKGDKGSISNAGRMPRGVLEPAPEYVLFNLPKDGVSEPVDTPRGYLVFKRID